MTTQDNNEAASALSAADAVKILRGALVQAECAIKGREHTGFIAKALAATEHITPAASASQSSTAGADTSVINTEFFDRLAEYEKAPSLTARMKLAEYVDSLAHVARQRQESAPTLIQACEEGNDRESPSWFEIHSNSVAMYRDEGYRIRYLYEIATPSAAVAEGVDTEEFRALEFKYGFSMRTADAYHTAENVNLAAEARRNLIGHIATYGAQQREAGRRDLVDELRTLCGKFGWREDGSGAVLLDRIAHQIRDLKACIAAHDALARQPVSEGLTESAVIEMFKAAGLQWQWLGDPGKAFTNGSTPLAEIARALSAVPPAKAEGMSDAAKDVLAERQRQVSAEGWTPAHDDAYKKDELQRAAMCYLMRPVCDATLPHALWPWDCKWWKPADDRRNLVKAGALILAEIERIDRAILAQQAKGERNGQ